MLGTPFAETLSGPTMTWNVIAPWLWPVTVPRLTRTVCDTVSNWPASASTASVSVVPLDLSDPGT